MTETMQGTQDFTIEQARGSVRNADYLLLAGIYKQAHPELERGSQSLVHLKETLDFLADPQNPNTGLLLARDRRARVVGAAMLYVMGEPASGRRGTVIEEIFVEKRSRGHGVGRLLLERSISFADEHDSAYAQLGPDPQNEAARHLFSSMDFSENEWGSLQLKLDS